MQGVMKMSCKSCLYGNLFQHLAEGYSVNEIAGTLSISPKAVGVHHTNIMKKLKLKNDAQLVRLAIRCNVIKP